MRQWKGRIADRHLETLFMSAYTALCAGLLFPLHERLKGHDSVAVRRRLEASQWRAPEQIAAEQAVRLRDFLVDIGTRVPYYRSLFKALSFDPREVREVSDLRRVDRYVHVETSSAKGVGAIIGGIVLTVVAARRRRSDILVGTIMLISISLTAYAVAPTTTLVAMAAAVLGSGGAAIFIMSSSLLQRDAPPHSRGRVMAMMHASLGVSYGIGIMIIGSIGDAVGLRIAFVSGAGALALGFWALTMRSSMWRAAIDGPAAQAVGSGAGGSGAGGSGAGVDVAGVDVEPEFAH